MSSSFTSMFPIVHCIYVYVSIYTLCSSSFSIPIKFFWQKINFLIFLYSPSQFHFKVVVWLAYLLGLFPFPKENTNKLTATFLILLFSSPLSSWFQSLNIYVCILWLLKEWKNRKLSFCLSICVPSTDNNFHSFFPS